jgi:hypothetical protein
MNTSQLATEISESAEKVIALISPLTNVQLNTIPFEGSWTAGQVARHIIKSTRGLPDDITRPADRPADQHVAALAATFLNFNVKYNSPEFVVPEDMHYEKNLVMTELNRIKEKNVEITKTENLSMLCMGFEFPTIGYLTRYEWLKFIVFHTERHARQLRAITEKLTDDQRKNARL